MEPNTEEEYENKVGELEQEIEEIEQYNSIHFGLIFGLLSYTQWHDWIYVLLIGVSMACVHWKFIAKKPFTKGIKTDKSS